MATVTISFTTGGDTGSWNTDDPVKITSGIDRITSSGNTVYIKKDSTLVASRTFTPKTGYEVSKFNGFTEGQLITSNIVVYPSIQKISYPVYVSVDPSGQATFSITNGAKYPLDTPLYISAYPTNSKKYKFWYWNINGSSAQVTDNPVTYNVKTSNSLKCKLTKVVYIIGFYGNGGKKGSTENWNYSINYDDIIYFINESCSRSSSTTQNNYTMTFYNYDKTVFNTSPITGSQTTNTYSLAGWSGSNGKEYQTNDWYQVEEAVDFTAKWNKTSTSTKGRLSSVAGTPSRWGYKFLNWMCDGSVVKAGNEYDGNKTATATWEPRKYNVSYSLYGNNAKWDDGQALVSFDKTFDSSLYLSEKIPSRFGYNFVGWHSNPEVKEENAEEWAKIIPAGGVFDDRFFNDSDKLVLYSIWKPIDQTCTFHYYNTDNIEVTYNKTYNIETPSPYQGKAPEYSRGQDWVFLGWVKRDPNDAEWKAKWIDDKGVYRNPDKAPQDYTLPYEIYVETIQEWDPKNVTHLYGFWTITGKYVNIGGDWKKVSVAYIKNNNDVWVPMAGNGQQNTSFSVNINGQWKEEVH